jgi:hypothetical protein
VVRDERTTKGHARALSPVWSATLPGPHLCAPSGISGDLRRNVLRASDLAGRDEIDAPISPARRKSGNARSQSAECHFRPTSGAACRVLVLAWARARVAHRFGVLGSILDLGGVNHERDSKAEVAKERREATKV